MAALALTIHADSVPSKILISSAAAATCYSIQLSHQPSATVAVAIECRNSMVQAQPSSLSFSPDDWDRPQHVFVDVRRVGAENGMTARIEHVLRSTDEDFNDRVPWLPVEYASIRCRSVLKFGDGSSKCYDQIELPAEDNRAMKMMKKVAKKKLEESTTNKQRLDRRKNYGRLLEENDGEKLSLSCCDILEGMSSDSDFGDRAENSELLARHAASNALRRAASTRDTASSAVAVSAGDSHSVILTANGAVFTCGSNELGQLGSGDRKTRGANNMNRVDFLFDEKEEADPVPSLSSSMFPSRLSISAIACGAFHTVAVSSEGALYAWGSNKFGQLGLGNSATDAVRPRRIPLNGVVSIVACGGSHTFCSAVADGGAKVFAWGNARTGALGISSTSTVSIPTEIESLRSGVLSVSCGTLHTACVDLNGRLLTCGANESYQLGRSRGAHDAFVVVPVLGKGQKTATNCVKATACQVGCGGSHTIVLMTSGELYCVGDNTYGQLGIGGHPSRMREFTRIEALANVHISSISVGSTASAALTTCGRCYMWGQRSCGQLGDAGPAVSLCNSLQQGLSTARNGPTDDVTLPTLAITLSACRVRRVALGRSHALAITDATRADAMLGRRRAHSFLRDIKAHFRVVKAYCMPPRRRKREQQTSFSSFRNWVKICKLYKVLFALRTEQLVRAHVHARAVAKIKRSKLDRILTKKNVQDGDDAPSYESTWLDRISVILLVQSRLAHIFYRSDQLSNVVYHTGIVSNSDALRLFAPHLQTFLGFVHALSLRVVSRLHRIAHDVALVSAAENLVHSRHKARRQSIARRRSMSKPPPIAVLATRYLSVKNTGRRNRRRERPRASVDTSSTSCHESVDTSISQLKGDERSPLRTTPECEYDATRPPAFSFEILTPEAPVPSRVHSYLLDETYAPACLPPEPQNFVSKIRKRNARRRATHFPETKRPYIPRILSAAQPILLRSYNKDTRLQMPAEVIEKKIAAKVERKKLREQESKRRRREILEMVRARQFEKWLKVLDQCKIPTRPDAPSRRPQSGLQARVDIRAGRERPLTSIGLKQ